MPYTKLFSSIITSTIWTEDNETRLVWITLLAIADKNGEVQASIPGLARLAGVSLESCEAAIHKFLSPDKHSRTKDDEGRRIEEIDGGWSLINHSKYRAMASKEESAAANAERQRRFRERKERNAVTSNAEVTHHRDIAEADTDAEAEADHSSASCDAGDGGFSAFWQAYPKKKSKGDAEKAWKKLKPNLAVVLAALENLKQSFDWKKEGGQFIPYPASWLNAKGWEDEVTHSAATQPAAPAVDVKKRFEDYYEAQYRNSSLTFYHGFQEWKKAGMPDTGGNLLNQQQP